MSFVYLRNDIPKLIMFLASWRAPYGQSGILKFFLEVIASTDAIGTDLLLHSLRLVGNSCADTGMLLSLLFHGQS